MLTPHGVKVEEDFSDDYGGIDDHQDAESQLNWSTLEKADRATSTSAQTNTHIHTDVHESNYDNNHHHDHPSPSLILTAATTCATTTATTIVISLQNRQKDT